MNRWIYRQSQNQFIFLSDSVLLLIWNNRWESVRQEIAAGVIAVNTTEQFLRYSSQGVGAVMEKGTNKVRMINAVIVMIGQDLDVIVCGQVGSVVYLMWQEK